MAGGLKIAVMGPGDSMADPIKRILRVLNYFGRSSEQSLFADVHNLFNSIGLVLKL